MKSPLVLQQEAVPRESINNSVSREYEFYLPKRIRGTSFFFDVILSAQVSAYVWSSHPSLSRSASTPPEKLTSLAPSNSCSTQYVYAFVFVPLNLQHLIYISKSYLPCNYVSQKTSQRLQILLTYHISFIVLTIQCCQQKNIIAVTSLYVWHIEDTQ